MAKLPDSKTIKEIAELLNDTGLSEIEVETGDVRIRVARQATAVTATIPATAPVASALGCRLSGNMRTGFETFAHTRP